MTKGESKFTRVYEDEHEKVTWTYDLDYYKHGPISVEIKTKNEQTNGKKTKDTRRGDAVSISNDTPRTRRSRQK